MEKSGYKTTEFWSMLATSVFTLLNQSGILGSFTVPVESVATVAGLVASYIIGRTIVKKATSV